MTARQTLRFRAGFFYRGPKSEVEDRIEETLKLVGLAGKADRPIKGFSGGELQRLGIAQAQVTYPDLLILDEPAANLDPRGRKDVLEVMARLRKYTTVFYSTHILDDVQQVSDTIAILNHGELVAQAPLEELLVGSSGSVYYVELKGETEKARVQVASQPWVSGIQVTHKNGTERWQVSVSDEAAAQSELLRLVLAEPSTSVIEFGLKKYDIEEVFLSVVEGGQDVQQ
jgi:ABC-2 type transport system ATP-binding protein